MPGGYMQLLAFGAEDIYLTGNPQMSFFKSVYRRYTNFSIECIEHHFTGTADFGKKVKFTIPRNGDLVYKIYYQIKLPALNQTQKNDGNDSTWVGYVNGIGNVLLKEVSLEVGSHIIDTHKSEYLDIWNQLTNNDENIDDLVGNLKSDLSIRTNAVDTNGKVYTIPLQFWFCRNTASALPLIGLQYHEVVITTEFRDALSCVRNGVAPGDTTDELVSPVDSNSVAIAFSDPKILIEYIFLDDKERLKFSNKPLEYLIDNVQYVGDYSVSANSTSATIDINIFHPCKELFWIIQDDTSIATNTSTGNKLLNYSDLDNPHLEMFKNANIMMNAMSRFAERDAVYFRMIQPMQRHTRVPDKKINVYSFSLNPEKYQPMGAANFSRLDNIQLIINFDSTNAFYENARTVKIYCVTYNIFKVQNGMGGVQFSN